MRHLDLVAAAIDPLGVSQSDKAELCALAEQLAGFVPSRRLSAAELAERVAPLLRVRLEADLAALLAWPLDTNAPVGLRARALLAAWPELTSGQPLVRCRTTGYAGSFPASRKRSLCDNCLAERSRDKVRRSRAAAAARAGGRK